MCEVFGACGANAIKLNSYLQSFFSHSPQHPNGWGLALLEGKEAHIEKEPSSAIKSNYLTQRLSVPVIAKTALAHIRYATIGDVEYRNCHPFSGKDNLGKRWTLVHNGTIFDYEPLHEMIEKQQGSTDSERILLYLTEQVRIGGFSRVDEIICSMSKGNKLNLLFYDGEYMYVHTNYEGSLHYLQLDGMTLFSTQPLSRENWQPLPMNQLLAYKDGKRVYEGTIHNNTYVDSAENTKFLYQIFSGL